MPRLYRESPLNGIWEGSGNVQCLDVLRGMAKNPRALEAFLGEVAEAPAPTRASTTAVDGAQGRVRGHRDDRVPRPARRRADGARAAGLPADPLWRRGGRRRVLRVSARGDSGRAFGTLPAGTDFDRIITRHAAA